MLIETQKKVFQRNRPAHCHSNVSVSAIWLQFTADSLIVLDYYLM